MTASLLLGSPPDAFRHAVEVLVRLEDRFHPRPRGGEGHDADHIRRQVEILRQLLDQLRAGEERDHLTLREELREILRQTRQRPNDALDHLLVGEGPFASVRQRHPMGFEVLFGEVDRFPALGIAQPRRPGEPMEKGGGVDRFG